MLDKLTDHAMKLAGVFQGVHDQFALASVFP